MAPDEFAAEVHAGLAHVRTIAFRQRADDVLDLGRAMIRRLRGEQQNRFSDIPEHSVLVVERLLPSDVVVLPKSVNPDARIVLRSRDLRKEETFESLEHLAAAMRFLEFIGCRRLAAVLFLVSHGLPLRQSGGDA